MSFRVVLSMLLLQGLATGGYVSSEDCPHPEDMYPCTCSYRGSNSDIVVTCRGAHVQEVERVFVNLRGKYVHKAVLSGLTGSRLSSFAFWSTRIKSLEFHDSNLEGLSDSEDRPSFVGLETSLETLTINRTVRGYNQLRKLDLAHLQHLKQLRLYNNTIPEIGNNWFANGPPNLTLLAIKDCDIKRLGDRAFAALVHLQHLYILGNPFKVIERTMIPNPALRLHDLNLSNDSLASLPDDFFSGMPALISLSLQGNLFRRLQRAVWTPVWSSLHNLSLHDNPIECDSHLDWMFGIKPPEFLHGTCHLPQDLNGTRLDRLIEINTKYMLPSIA